MLGQLPTFSAMAPGLIYKRFAENDQAIWMFLLWGQFQMGATVNFPEEMRPG